MSEETDIAKLNQRIREGWTLTKVEYRPVYFLEKSQGKPADTMFGEAPSQGHPSTKESAVPLSIHWVAKNDGFAWAFATEKDGSVIPDIASFVEKLKRSSIEENGFKYSLSKDGRLLARNKK